jgi:uncharacterized protein YbbK (DUF523 family)
MSHTQHEIVLVSACLAGLCTRYDGRLRPSPACLEALAGTHWLPVCPEQLGGLPTPRPAADLTFGDGYDVLAGRSRVVTEGGQDVTRNFLQGARQCLALAQAQHIRRAYLKARSPSCGLTPRIGVTAAFLVQHGIEVVEYP